MDQNTFNMIFTNVFQQLKNPKRSLFFRFWANCILVRGFRRGIVYDIQRERIFPLSDLFCDMYFTCKDFPIHTIYKDMSLPHRLGYFKIINFLIENDFGILVDKVETLPDLSTRYESPFIITNSIVHIDSEDLDSLCCIINQLTKLRIQAIQIEDTNKLSIETLKRIDEWTKYSTIESINIRTNYSSIIDSTNLRLSSRFRHITFYNSPFNVKPKRKDNSFVEIIYSSNNFLFSDCGNIGKDYFVNNLLFFVESQCHNTCLNRKVCIDLEGNIKNCPLMSKSYGNIKDTTLEEAINKPGYKDLWYINKDKIDVCKDCEYRYMCTDCRVFINDPKNIYSQPAKCTYNPYICLWEDQDGYVPVDDCGIYDHKIGFVPDTKRIEKLNKQIWGK